jgi:hypothetical protein
VDFQAVFLDVCGVKFLNLWQTQDVAHRRGINRNIAQGRAINGRARCCDTVKGNLVRRPDQYDAPDAVFERRNGGIGRSGDGTGEAVASVGGDDGLDAGTNDAVFGFLDVAVDIAAQNAGVVGILGACEDRGADSCHDGRVPLVTGSMLT